MKFLINFTQHLNVKIYINQFKIIKHNHFYRDSPFSFYLVNRNTHYEKTKPFRNKRKEGNLIF